MATTCLLDLLPSNMTIGYDRNDASDRRSMHEEVLAIEALPFVTKLSQHAHSRSKAAGFRASLSCYVTREHGGCGTQQESPICISLQRPTLLACLKELHARLKEKHLEKCHFILYCMHTYIHAHVYITHTYMHTYTNINTHKYIHTGL